MNNTKNITIDFYGSELADYKKAKDILVDIRKIEGCDDASFYQKESVTLAGYSSIILGWVIDNKEFLVAFATFLYMLLKDKKGECDKLVLVNNTEITYKDNPKEIRIKLEKAIRTF